MNIGGDTEADRFQGAVRLYGLEKARSMLRGWPEASTIVSVPPDTQKIADVLIGDFAGHRIGMVSLDEIKEAAGRMSKQEFADYFTGGVDPEWKKQNPQHHSSWWTYDKLAAGLRAAGFTDVYRSEPYASKFHEMVGVSKYWSFDHTRTDTGLYVEAVKS